MASRVEPEPLRVSPNEPAPIAAGATGNVAYVGRGCPAQDQTPADGYLANPAGKIALIDRGACNVSLKIDRAAKAGAIGALIGLVAPGEAISFSFGGGDTFVPSLVITLSTSNLIKANIGAPVNVTISLTNSTSIVGSVVGSSSRGPRCPSSSSPDTAIFRLRYAPSRMAQWTSSPSHSATMI